MFQPYTTLYICSGTGLDMENSIWWHRFAYSTSVVNKDDSWWNTCFQWVKAHSIAGGYWYLTTIRPELGYVDVGRTNLQKVTQWQEEGLGNSAKQAELDDPYIPYAEALTGADYLVFGNDSIHDGDEYHADPIYAFINSIERINFNTARIYFTVDAIMTYQKFITLGRCFVLQDMQFQERQNSVEGAWNPKGLNYQPEDIVPSDEQYVFQQFYGTTQSMQDIEFGPYGTTFVMTDISLDPEDIKSNEWYSGLIAVKPSKGTYVYMPHPVEIPMPVEDYVNGVNLGIGVYYAPNREDEAFEKLGSFNAMEHILLTYNVPVKLCKWNPDNALGNPKFVTTFSSGEDSDDVAMEAKYQKPVSLIFNVPNEFDDDTTLTILDSGSSESGEGIFKPVNTKTCFAPYNYFSITDKQGNSLEVQPQALNPYLSTDANWIQIYANMEISIAPNVLSSFYIDSLTQINGSRIAPLLTLWEMPVYSMTPNNSGYNNFLPQMIANSILGVTNVAIGSGMSSAGNLSSGLGSILGGIIGGRIAGKEGASLGASLGSMPGSNLKGLGTSFSSGGANLIMQAEQNVADYVINRVYGLPKAVGGSPQNMTTYMMKNAGYALYRVHLKTDLLKLIDYRFSIVGYAQNAFRYPHINIRRRWCYVKLGSVNIVPIPANNYNSGGVPFAMRQQIVQRLKAGVTFWNLRQALMGDADNGASDVQSWDDSRIQNNIYCKFVRNYGTAPDSDIVKENASFTNGYANDYTDDYEQEL